MKIEDIQKLLEEELAEQKKIASSATRNKTIGRKTWFPHEIMSRKEKYNYRKSGKVEVYHMYDKIMSKEEFLALSVEEQKKALKRWRDLFTNTEVKRTWGMGDYEYSKLLKKHGFVKGKGANKKIAELVAETVQNPQQPQVVNMVSGEEVSRLFDSMVERLVAATAQPVDGGVRLAINGRFDGKTGSAKLLKFAQMIEDEGCEFQITVNIEEVKRLEN